MDIDNCGSVGILILQFVVFVLIVVDDVHKSSAAMHLMYTLDESGNRIYTLNVSIYTFTERLLSDSPFQKATDTGRITKSAHPGSSLLAIF